MKNSFKIEVADPRKIFLVWWMHKEFGDEEISFQHDDIRNVFEADYHLCGVLEELRLEGLFSEIEIEKWIWGEEGDDPEEKHIYLVSNKKPKSRKKNVQYNDSMPDIPYSRDGSRLWCTLKIPQKNIVSYIEQYLSKWRNDELYFEDGNILKCKNQIAEVVEEIFRITGEFSYKNMLISASNVERHRILDFVSVILFLESVDALEVVGYTFQYNGQDVGQARVHFRVTLADRFFQNFIETSKGVDFSFERLVTPQKSTKQILFEPPFRLHSGKKDYRLNRGGVPHLLMNMSFDDRQLVSVKVDVLRERAKVSEDALDKALENFRRSMRSKFGFPESEPFFDVRDGEIRLDSVIFQKKVKKV